MKAVAERLDTPGTSLTQSFILRKYLREAPLDEAKKRSLQWIRDYPEGYGVSDSFSFLIANFAEERPRARTWLMAHKYTRQGMDVIAALIKIGDQEALEIAKANIMALRNDSVIDSRMHFMFFRDIFRAIAHSFPNQLQSPWMQDWIAKNANHEGLSMLCSSMLKHQSR